MKMVQKYIAYGFAALALLDATMSIPTITNFFSFQSGTARSPFTDVFFDIWLLLVIGIIAANVFFLSKRNYVYATLASLIFLIGSLFILQSFVIF